VVLVNQRGLQFVPRVQAVRLGQAVRFTNGDSETHNVHVISPGSDYFNESMAPGQPRDFTPKKPGVVRLACDIHSHMRGYLVVSASPWAQVCAADGRFRLDGVPDGEYRLTVWHEAGDPLRRRVTVAGGEAVDLGALTLTATAAAAPAPGRSVPARPWSEVIDRVGVRLASALDAAGKARDFKKARKQAEDAYWVEFEGSDMETAVRQHLGYARAAGLERRFRAVTPALRGLAGRTSGPERAVDATRQLLLGLVQASGELNRKGVTDAAHLKAAATEAPAAADAPAPDPGDHPALLAALGRGFEGVRALADRGEADEAAAAMTDVYFDRFEPLERFILARQPTDVQPLEARFNTVRGRVGAGLKGNELAAALGDLQDEVKGVLGRSEARGAGAFGPAFAASLVTAVREGTEVILLLAMLIALAAKAGQAGALRAIAWGVGLAVLASAATALGLNLMVASAQGRTREVLEGGVMLAASALLFYVSYWLISQSESRRWTEFLKRRLTAGGGGAAALLATAFLAVYREGAETALMYQAMIGTQAGSRAGLTGLAAGLGVGVVALAGVAYAVRATSARLPLRAFFQATGAALFAMAVVFAGNGVFALQSSGVLKVTPLTWLGPGLPALGVHPNVQALSVQALLLAGAALAGVFLLLDDHAEAPRATRA
jgi:high-affinity iron transporter